MSRKKKKHGMKDKKNFPGVKVRRLRIDTDLSVSGLAWAMEMYRESWDGLPPYMLMVHHRHRILAMEIIKGGSLMVSSHLLPLGVWMLIGTNGIIYSDGTD